MPERLEPTKLEPKKKKSKPPLVSGRTLALGGVFLALVCVVGFQYLPSRTEEIPADPAPTDANGNPIPAPVPIPTPDPKTLPPGSTEEIRLN